MTDEPLVFTVGELYSSSEIQTGLGVGNAGGVRVALGDAEVPRRMVVMTSAPAAKQARENPYHDRIEGTTLVYTGAGREGDQSLGGVNQRIPQQLLSPFPIYGFVLVASRRDQTVGPRRWRFLGLLQFLRHYPEMQVDIRLQQRRVWVFEFRILAEPRAVVVVGDRELYGKVLSELPRDSNDVSDREVAPAGPVPMAPAQMDPRMIERMRGRLLGVGAERFEHIVKEALQNSGFVGVEVTRFSQDGGIDVNAHVGAAMWPIRQLLVQVQAKRWLHTVGRKEVAELRGSLQPYARGAIVTTSHFSRAAAIEAEEPGKVQIALVDGHAFASIVATLGIEP